MTSEREDSPYAPPAAPTAQRTRWRLIPTVLLGIFGSLMCIGSAILLITFFISANRPPARLLEPPGMMLLSGITWLVSAYCWWRRRWLMAIILTVIGYGLGTVSTVYE